MPNLEIRCKMLYRVQNRRNCGRYIGSKPIYQWFWVKNAIFVWMCQIIVARCCKHNNGAISGIYRGYLDHCSFHMRISKQQEEWQKINNNNNDNNKAFTSTLWDREVSLFTMELLRAISSVKIDRYCILLSCLDPCLLSSTSSLPRSIYYNGSILSVLTKFLL